MVSLHSVSKWYPDYHDVPQNALDTPLGPSREDVFTQAGLQKPQVVLHNINLFLKGGDFLYIFGESGAGKTTLLNILSGSLSPSLGNVSLFGHMLSTASSSVLSAIRRTIAIIPQDVRLIPELSVYDNVALSLSLARKHFLRKEARRQIVELLTRLGLQSLMHKPASQLSGGEAQRVAIARAFIRSPQLILADEPTGHQDRESTWLIMDLFLKAHQAGAAVVIASHDRELVRRIRKTTVLLRNGTIQYEEPLCIY